VEDIVRSLPVLWPVVVTWAEEQVKPPGWDTFAQYSVLGLAVLGFGFLFYRIFMQLWARSSVELTREVARADRLEADNRELNLASQDKAIPALFAAANALTECTSLLRELQRERERERENALRRRERDGDSR